MKSFLLSILVALVIAGMAAVILDRLPHDSATTHQAEDNVRL